MRHLSENEFKEWLEHPVTVAVKALFRAKRAELLNDWAEGKFTYPLAESTVMKNAEKIGVCGAYAEFAELSYEDYETENQDAERVGATPSGEGSVDTKLGT